MQLSGQLKRIFPWLWKRKCGNLLGKLSYLERNSLLVTVNRDDLTDLNGFFMEAE